MTVKRQKHFMDTLCAMLGAGEPADPRQAARYRWLHETAARWLDASKRCDAAWKELVRDIPDEVDDDELDILPPPEEAEVDALWGQLNDVIQDDKWPRHLYWGCV
jgi:hypothetical protein